MTSSRTEPIPVVCLWLIQDGKILVVQRGSGKAQADKWEFPGGKIEFGESPGAAIRREIREELDIEIQPMVTMAPIEHVYPDFTIRLIPVYCTWMHGEMVLHEHEALRWVRLDELHTLDLAEADAVLAGHHEETLSGMLR